VSVAWYVLHSKPHKEEFLAEQLWLRKIESFSPRIRVQVVNPRARKIKPYFPGYVFIHVDPDTSPLSQLRYVPGASDLVMFGEEAAQVPDGLIQAIRRRVDEINAAGGELMETLKPGAAVVIHPGPFAGYEAIFDVHLPGSDRVRVLLQLLKKRQMPVELPAGLVSPKK
jgi:transcription elongation factor/antiterminator RfaH